MRRRHPTRKPKKDRARRSRPEWIPRNLDGLTWIHWTVLAAGVLAVSFGVGFLLATQVIFPRPDTAGTGLAVPDLLGRDSTGARQALAKAGLDVDTVVSMASAGTPAGQVLAQDPVPGQELRPGGAVAVAVSSGPPRVSVPALVGLGAATAQSLLERTGFSVEVRQVSDSRLPRGTVTGTEPSAGAVLPLPGSVLILVSAGSPSPPSDTILPALPRPEGT